MKTTVKTLIIFFVNVALCVAISFIQDITLFLLFVLPLEAFVLTAILLKEKTKRYRAILASALAIALSVAAGITSILFVTNDNGFYVTGFAFLVATVPLLAAAILFACKQNITLKAGIIFAVAVVIWDLIAFYKINMETVGAFLAARWL